MCHCEDLIPKVVIARDIPLVEASHPLWQSGAAEPHRSALFPVEIWPDVPCAIYTRSLVASYLYRDSVLAWQCSVCRKMFCRTLEEAVRQHCTRGRAPDYIEREFRLHLCELALVLRQEKYEADWPKEITVVIGRQ